MNALDHLPAITERIVKRFDPLQIILFGSHARGDARPDSDLDFVVVFPSISNKHQLLTSLLREVWGLPVAVDLVLTTPEELERRSKIPGSVLRPAVQEGRLVYARAR